MAANGDNESGNIGGEEIEENGEKNRKNIRHGTWRDTTHRASYAARARSALLARLRASRAAASSWRACARAAATAAATWQTAWRIGASRAAPSAARRMRADRAHHHLRRIARCGIIACGVRWRQRKYARMRRIKAMAKSGEKQSMWHQMLKSHLENNEINDGVIGVARKKRQRKLMASTAGGVAKANGA
jgi:hypothetical protein